jgi:hypothetical protein
MHEQESEREVAMVREVTVAALVRRCSFSLAEENVKTTRTSKKQKSWELAWFCCSGVGEELVREYKKHRQYVMKQGRDSACTSTKELLEWKQTRL